MTYAYGFEYMHMAWDGLRFYGFWIGHGKSYQVPKVQDSPELGTMTIFQYNDELIWLWAWSPEEAFDLAREYVYRNYPGDRKLRMATHMGGMEPLYEPDQPNKGKYFS